MRPLRQRLDRLWLATLAATALAGWIGEWGPGVEAAWPVLAVFALALAKGLAIALEFMELRDAPAAWRRFVVGWLLVVVLAIVAVHLTAR